MNEAEILKREYDEWKSFDSTPSDELERALDWAWHHPSSEIDSFFEKLVEIFSAEKDPFWIDEAIKYSQRAKDKLIAQKYLEEILTDYSRFSLLGSSLGTAAMYLGKLAHYPNRVLAQAISFSNLEADEFERSNQNFLNERAFGGYIASATDFSTGLEAARKLDRNQKKPSIEFAEEIIADWRAKHQVTT